MPGVAGFLMNTLPTASVEVAKPRARPNSMTHSTTRSSCFEGRGLAFNAAKFSHNARGSRLATAWLMDWVLVQIYNPLSECANPMGYVRKLSHDAGEVGQRGVDNLA